MLSASAIGAKFKRTACPRSNTHFALTDRGNRTFSVPCFRIGVYGGINRAR